MEPPSLLSIDLVAPFELRPVVQPLLELGYVGMLVSGPASDLASWMDFGPIFQLCLLPCTIWFLTRVPGGATAVVRSLAVSGAVHRSNLQQSTT